MAVSRSRKDLFSHTPRRSVLDQISDAVIIVDNKRVVKYLNAAAEKQYGVTRKGIVGRKLSELYRCVLDAEEIQNHEPQSLHGSFEEGGNDIGEHVHVKPNGERVFVESSVSELRDSQGKSNGMLFIIREVSERKAAEKALSQARLDWERTFDSVPDLIAILDVKHRVVRANRAMAQRLGKTAEQCVGLSCFECLHRTNRPVAHCPHVETLRDGKEHIAEIHDDQLGGDFIVSTTPLSDEKGKIVGSVHVARDITKHKKLELELFESLEASQRRQTEIAALLAASRAVLQHREFKDSARAIFDVCKELLEATAGYVALLSSDGRENDVLFLDSGGLPCSVNPSLPMPIRGLRAEAYHTGKVVYCNDFVESNWASLMPEGHVTLNNVLFAPMTIDRKTVGIIGLANKKGGFSDRDAGMALAFGEIASVALINSRMLEMLEENERRLREHSERLEELVEERSKKLKETERLATIGETAGMVGHDIRNPLQSIIGELYLMMEEIRALPEGDAKNNLKDSLKLIEKQTLYINKIVSDLQDFAKPLKPCIEEVNLEKAFQDIISTLDIPVTIHVSYSVESGLPNLKTDPAFVKRVLTNLVSNAVQAMKDGGNLTLGASCRNGVAFISVEDTGEGIPEHARENLFKPLFTTKAKGQGFGLAIIKRFTEALGGCVIFETEVGKGTKFTIEIPCKS